MSDTGPEVLPGLPHRHGFCPGINGPDASRPCAGGIDLWSLEQGNLPRRASAAGGLVVRGDAGGQAALVSSCWTLDAGELLIAIRRGFIASGISRISSICN